jgi:citrate lyase subunit beta/citryl-CoA lyase
MRSLLVVPANGAEEMELAAGSGADAVVLDLDLEMGLNRRDEAREATVEWLNSHRKQVLEGRHFARWVRISPLSSSHWRDDLLTAMVGAPDGIFLPAVPNPAQVQQLGAEFYEIEQAAGIPHGATQIIPMVADNPISALHIGEFAKEPHPRLAGLAWNAARLGGKIDARRERNRRGDWCGAFAFVRAQMVLAAKAHGLKAIESGQPKGIDPARLEHIASGARADGFTGMFAHDHEQVPLINRAFTTNEREVAIARNVEARFADQSYRDPVEFGGDKLDPAELDRARQLLEAAPRQRESKLG